MTAAELVTNPPDMTITVVLIVAAVACALALAYMLTTPPS